MKADYVQKVRRVGIFQREQTTFPADGFLLGFVTFLAMKEENEGILHTKNVTYLAVRGGHYYLHFIEQEVQLREVKCLSKMSCNPSTFDCILSIPPYRISSTKGGPRSLCLQQF